MTLEGARGADRPRVEAAVLVPIYRDPRGELRFVLVRRTEHGAHGGQLAFPGGTREPADGSFRETALREAKEEIGLGPRHVEVLDALPVLDTETTNFRIHPFLARVRRPERWVPEEREVLEVLEPALGELLDPERRGTSRERHPAWPEPRRIAFIRVGPHRLWGATYRILETLLPRIAAGEWRL